MADVELNIGTGGGKINSSPITIGDVTGRDHIDHGSKLDAVDILTAKIEAQARQIEELNRMVFGDNRLGVSSVREEIRGLRFWNITATVITVVWVIYEIIHTFLQ